VREGLERETCREGGREIKARDRGHGYPSKKNWADLDETEEKTRSRLEKVSSWKGIRRAAMDAEHRVHEEVSFFDMWARMKSKSPLYMQDGSRGGGN